MAMHTTAAHASPKNHGLAWVYLGAILRLSWGCQVRYWRLPGGNPGSHKRPHNFGEVMRCLLGLSWDRFGPSLGYLGLYWGLQLRYWRPSGGNPGYHLGLSLDHLGPSWGYLGARVDWWPPLDKGNFFVRVTKHLHREIAINATKTKGIRK